jgi:hypothetical protein
MGFAAGPAWYQDQDRGVTREAWHSSAEFIGRHLDELRVQPAL